MNVIRKPADPCYRHAPGEAVPYAAITVRPLTPGIGAELRGSDRSRLLTASVLEESDVTLRYLFKHLENQIFQCRFAWQPCSPSGTTAAPSTAPCGITGRTALRQPRHSTGRGAGLSFLSKPLREPTPPASLRPRRFAMPMTKDRTISLSTEQARYVDRLITSGTYATADEVVGAALGAMQEQDAEVERWLRDEVVPVAAAMEADPGRAIPADEVFASIRALYEQRLSDDPG